MVTLQFHGIAADTMLGTLPRPSGLVERNRKKREKANGRGGKRQKQASVTESGQTVSQCIEPKRAERVTKRICKKIKEQEAESLISCDSKLWPSSSF